jgi:hypothetical protein
MALQLVCTPVQLLLLLKLIVDKVHPQVQIVQCRDIFVHDPLIQGRLDKSPSHFSLDVESIVILPLPDPFFYQLGCYLWTTHRQVSEGYHVYMVIHVKLRSTSPTLPWKCWRTVIDFVRWLIMRRQHFYSDQARGRWFTYWSGWTDWVFGSQIDIHRWYWCDELETLLMGIQHDIQIMD